MSQPIARQRARDQAPAPGDTPVPRSHTAPALVEPASRQWRAMAKRLADESSLRERRLRRCLALSDAVAVAVALLISVAIASPDPLTPLALLLLPAVVGLAKILGLYEHDDQRIRKTTAEELPQLAQLGAMLLLAVWLADEWLIGGPAGKDQALVLGLVFVTCAVLGRRSVRSIVNRSLAPERCLFIGDEFSYARLRTIFERHELPLTVVGVAWPGSSRTVKRVVVARPPWLAQPPLPT